MRFSVMLELVLFIYGHWYWWTMIFNHGRLVLLHQCQGIELVSRVEGFRLTFPRSFPPRWMPMEHWNSFSTLLLFLSLSLLVSSIRFVSIAKGMTSSQNVRAPHPSVSIEISGNCVATVWSRSTIRVVSNQIQTQYVCRLTSSTGFCDWRSVRADIHFLHLYRRHIWLNNTFDERKGWKKYYEIKFIFVFFW